MDLKIKEYPFIHFLPFNGLYNPVKESTKKIYKQFDNQNLHSSQTLKSNCDLIKKVKKHQKYAPKRNFSQNRLLFPRLIVK